MSLLYPDIWNWEKGDGLWIDRKKAFMKWGLHKIAKRYDKMMERKLEEGWINFEAKWLYDCFNQFTDFYEDSYTGPAGKKPGTDPRRQMHQDLRNIVCIMADQDSHYLVEIFVMLSIFHANYQKLLYRERYMFPKVGDWEKYKSLMMRGLTVEMTELEDVTVKKDDNANPAEEDEKNFDGQIQE